MGLSNTKEPVGYGAMDGPVPGSPGSGPVPANASPAFAQAHYETTKPLALSMPVGYHARHGAEGGMQVQRRQQNKSHVFFERWRINGPILLKAIIAGLVPPVIFFW